MAEEHKDELGLYGRIDAPKIEGEAGEARLEDYLSNRMQDVLSDESILKAIDKDIKSITDSQENTESKRKNLKRKVNDEI